MKVTNEKTENSQVFLTIEMEPAEVEEWLEKSYSRLVKKVRIPGFRKGKASRVILERHIGRGALLDDALGDLVPHAYDQAIKEQEIEAIASPSIEITQTDPVVFKATVPIKPTIELDDYHHIQVESEPVEITEEDISTAIEELRHHHATWKPVERPIDFDDLVILDIDSDIEGKPFINQKGVQYQVLHDLPFPTPGFAEKLPGMKRGEEREFKLQFPLDYPRDELSGKEASFKVRINEIKQKILPELNDEFAREVNPDSKTLDSLREQASTELRHQAEEKAKVDFEERVIEAVIDLTKLEFPPIFVEQEIDQLLREQVPHLEEYLSRINKTEEQLREELRPLATKRVTRSLVLGKIAEEEKIEVSDAEIESEIEKLTKSATENKDELQKFLNTPQARQSIRQLLITRKTIQRLVEIAKGSGREENTNDQRKQ